MPTPVITLGADPEYFVINEIDMEVVPMVELAGTKEKPIPFAHLGEGYNYHRDNVLLELGVPPTTSIEDATYALSRVRKAATTMLQDEIGDSNIYFHQDLWHFADDDLYDPVCHEFGCEPDQDAYEGGAMRAVPDGAMGNWRSAGGHIHIGSDRGFNCPGFIVALLCDAWIMYNEPCLRKDTGEGYLWYRKPGLYRDKPYGIEYRTPSNYWTFQDNGWGTYDRAMTVGRFCANASAASIRDLIEKIDWVHVRAKIMGHATNLDSHRELMRKHLRAYFG